MTQHPLPIPPEVLTRLEQAQRLLVEAYQMLPNLVQVSLQVEGPGVAKGHFTLAQNLHSLHQDLSQVLLQPHQCLVEAREAKQQDMGVPF